MTQDETPLNEAQNAQAEKSRLIQEAQDDMLSGPFGHHVPEAPQPE